MLTNVDVFGVDPSPTVLSLAVSGALGSDPIQFRGADGLDPVKADINTQSYGGIDDAAYLGSSIGPRNIVFKLGLNPDWQTQTMESLRQLLYTYFMPKTNVKLRFRSTHLPTCEIFGYVESMEPNMFSKDPEILVSIICPKSDFVAVDQTIVNGVVGAVVDGIAPAEDDITWAEIDYIGSRPAGIHLEVSSNAEFPFYEGFLSVVLRTVVDRTIYVFGVDVDADRTFMLNSIPGEKYIQNSQNLNLLPNLSTIYTDWPMLLRGINQFSVAGSVGGQDWELSYFARFGGL